MLLMFLFKKSLIFLCSCRVVELWQLGGLQGVTMCLSFVPREKEGESNRTWYRGFSHLLHKKIAACSVKDLSHLHETDSSRFLPSSPKQASFPPNEN